MNNLKSLIFLLGSKHLTVAAAESCTGGYLSYLLTKTPGSSRVFKGALVAYALEIKHKFLGLNNLLLEKTQGVSRDVAIKLAQNVRRRFNTDLGTAVVGFAGPEGAGKIPAGTVFIAVSCEEKTIAQKFVFRGGRDHVRKQAAQQAIKLIAASCDLRN